MMMMIMMMMMMMIMMMMMMMRRWIRRITQVVHKSNISQYGTRSNVLEVLASQDRTTSLAPQVWCLDCEKVHLKDPLLLIKNKYNTFSI